MNVFTTSLTFTTVIAITFAGCIKGNPPSMPQAWAAYEEGRNEDAIELFSEILESESENVDAFCGRGLAFHNKGFGITESEDLRTALGRLADLKSAIADFDSAISIDPTKALCHEYRADTHWVLGQLKSAREGYTRSIELDPESATSFSSRAEVVASLGDVSNALADISAAIKIAPENHEFRFSKGCLLHENGDSLEALKELNSIQQEFSDSARFYDVRSEVLRQLGKSDEAMADQKTAKSLRRDK